MTYITAANSPYTASAGQTIVVGTNGGSVIVKLPTLSSGQAVTVAHDSATSLASATVTIEGPTGVQLAQPPPNNGTFSASYVMAGSQGVGMSATWYNGGSSSGYLFS